MLDETFTPPDGLDPVAELEDHLAVGWEFDVDVVIHAPAEQVTPRLPRALGRLQPLDGASCRLVGSTSNPGWYAEQLAVIPAAFTVVGGAEVRAEVEALGRRLLKAVAD